MLILIMLLCFEGSGTTVVSQGPVSEHIAVCCFGSAFPRRDVAPMFIEQCIEHVCSMCLKGRSFRI